mgnify:CR=1 FL=1
MGRVLAIWENKMINVLWILTIGSSDIQLESKATTQERKKSPADVKRLNSDQVWKSWYDSKFQSQIRAEYGSLVFNPTPTGKDKDPTYRIEARLLGMLYQYYQGNAVQDEIWSYLTFPLLKNFVDELGKEERQKPDSIALILTDQSAIFTTKQDRKEESPYWQDTYCLEPILERYFQSKYPDTEILKFQQNSEAEPQSIILSPEDGAQGLDDWNSVLELVRIEFKRLSDRLEKDKIEPELVYVSHQAGTPAISSAVQFCSLATFGDRIKFLISNEYNPKLTSLVKSSSYLRGIKREQAKKLLENHDYAGVNSLVGEYLKGDKKTLLQAALQWNYAKFDDEDGFADELTKLVSQDFQGLVQMVDDRRQYWWWTAYEAAYLSFIRLDQRNGVEAFFHGFRAVEGLISKWAEVHFSEHIEPNNDSPKLKSSILEVPGLNYLGKSKYAKHRAKLEQDGTVILSGFYLYALLRSAKPKWKEDCKEITDFIEKISPTRNKVFHRLRGLEINDVFEAWLIDKTKTIEKKKLTLEEKIRKYLNFVSEQDFQSLEEASLMAKVHTELERAIAAL